MGRGFYLSLLDQQLTTGSRHRFLARSLSESAAFISEVSHSAVARSGDGTVHSTKFSACQRRYAAKSWPRACYRFAGAAFNGLSWRPSHSSSTHRRSSCRGGRSPGVWLRRILAKASLSPWRCHCSSAGTIKFL